MTYQCTLGSWDLAPPPFECPTCGAPPGAHCRTPSSGTLLPTAHPHRYRVEVEHLRRQRDELHAALDREVANRRELARAARYVLDNVGSHPGILDHLTHALEAVRSGPKER